jgi:hypothetical protein
MKVYGCHETEVQSCAFGRDSSAVSKQALGFLSGVVRDEFKDWSRGSSRAGFPFSISVIY